MNEKKGERKNLDTMLENINNANKIFNPKML